jgi:hypothetical protein
MIVRLLLWRLDGSLSLTELRDRLDELEPLAAPSTWLWNEPQETFGALLLLDDDEGPPDQVTEIRQLLARDPDVYEEFDAIGP